MRKAMSMIPLRPSTAALAASVLLGCAAGPEHGASTPSSAPAPTSAPADASVPDAAVLAAANLARPPGPDESAMDPATPACNDFYEYACGGWMKATPIPPDESSWVRSFSVIHEENQKALRDILERDARGDTHGDAYGDKLGTFWSACMDERSSTAELDAELTRVASVRDVASLAGEIAHLANVGVSAPFDFDTEVDFKDASMMIAVLSQSGLGLPERDYYFRQDARSKELRAQYLDHVSRTLELVHQDVRSAEADAKTILSLETELAQASMTNVALRDPKNVYHRFERSDLKTLARVFPWDSFFSALGSSDITTLNVAQPEFVKRIDALAKTRTMADWRAYLRWHLVASVSPWLSQDFVDEWFRFRQILTGAKELQPRWKRCVKFADQMMGEALARPFVEAHLGQDGKMAAQRMVAGIEQSMRSDLESLSWMDDPTRAKAEAKLEKVANKIGFPDKWRNYDSLSVDGTSFLKTMEAATEFEVKRRLAKAGRAVDRNEWDMTPPTVNAYYDPSMNQMVFPAGILQAPFYGKEQAPAANFGAIGMVVGHELTHGFDDEGRQFDGDGNLRDWWSRPVGAEFDKRSSCVANQFDAYVPIDDVHIKGKLTLGENIADLGGVKLSYAAFERSGAAGGDGKFTPEQQFFLSFAQSWCGNYRPEALRLLLATNPHSPPKFRVDGPLSNLPAFAEAFHCAAGSPMVRDAKDRCEIW